MILIKAIVYRILRILLLLITTFFLILGDIFTALSISVVDTIIATLYYYYYYFDKSWSVFEKKIKHWKLEYKYRKMNKEK